MRWIGLVSLTPCLVAALAAAEDKGRSFTFRKEDVGKLPPGWKAAQTGKGKGSAWEVVADRTAPSESGYALAQTASSPRAMFNLCVAEGPSYKDVEVQVAFKAVEGEEDQGGGVVWRYQDANNYYVARMNPLEDNFRVYKVVAGTRAREFQSEKVLVKAGEWHTLKVRMVGDHIECSLDGKKYLDVKDRALTKAGKVGLWTKADARTRFDDFRVTKVGK